MTRLLSLSPQTVLPCTPIEQLDAAVIAGFDTVGLRLFPVTGNDADVMSDPATRGAIEQRIADARLNVLDVEVVRATPTADADAILPALDFASRLGARWLAVTAAPIDEYDPAEEAEVVRCLRDFCDRAGSYGMRVALEFMAFRGIQTVQQTMDIIAAVQHPALGFSIDALHFFRSGGRVSDLVGIDTDLIACVHLSDAPEAAPADLISEARENRLYPGDGALPLVELLSVLPADLPVAVEVPTRDRLRLSAAERAERGASTARSLLEIAN